MDNKTLTIWGVIFAVGAINYATRLSFIAFFARRDMPPFLARALRYVPAAMLTAIVVPAIVFVPAGELRLDLANARLLAAIIAAVVAWRWRNTTMTIAVGMVTLWLVEYLLR